MDAAADLLALPIYGGEEDLSATVVRAKTSILKTVMATQAKVDETRLRRASVDRLPELLKLADQVRAKLPLKLPAMIEGTVDRILDNG